MREQIIVLFNVETSWHWLVGVRRVLIGWCGR